MLSRPRTSAAMQPTAIEWRANLPGRVSLHGEVPGLFFAAVAQLAERRSSTSEVAGSTPVRRSKAPVAQRIEQLNSSQPVVGSIPAGRAIHSQTPSHSKHLAVIAASSVALRSKRRSLRRAHRVSLFTLSMKKILDDRLRVQGRVQPLYFPIGGHMQYQLPLMCVLNGPKRVPEDVLNTWQSLHDAIAWSFKERGSDAVKTTQWLAEHLQMRRQHVSRMIKRQDLKLDSIQGHVWDCLTGWTAYEQYTQLEKRRISERAAADMATAIQARMAA